MTQVNRQVGRPPKWESTEELVALINAYFEETPREEITVTGLALAIGTCRQTLLNYTEKNDDFAQIIKEAKTIIENAYEISLRRRGQTGDIFALKNFGWIDRRETDITSKNERIMPGVVEAKAADILEDESES